MASLIYEHPLNEKIRNYLRLEQLFAQLTLSRPLSEPLQQQVFFRSLFELAEILERSDWRNDLIKDLSKQSEKLQQWAALPGIDTAKIDQLIELLQILQKQLTQLARLGSHLKEDRLLASVRQRVTLPGGNCSFDLPQLHFWLNQAPELITTQVQAWLAPFSAVEQAITQLLEISRDQRQFNDITATNGFYQGLAEGCCLLRIELNQQTQAYPTISGHKHRFAIKFLSASGGECADIPFRLYCCKLA